MNDLLKDTTEEHAHHLFDSNCKICTGKMMPPGESQTTGVSTTMWVIVINKKYAVFSLPCWHFYFQYRLSFLSLLTNIHILEDIWFCGESNFLELAVPLYIMSNGNMWLHMLISIISIDMLCLDTLISYTSFRLLQHDSLQLVLSCNQLIMHLNGSIQTMAQFKLLYAA